MTMESSQEHNTTSNTTVIRRQQLLALLAEFVRAQVSHGHPPKGLEQAFAAQLQISPSLLSQVKNSRPIGDKLARQIEVGCEKSPGWLDLPGQSVVAPSAAEEAFIELAKSAWRRSNAKGKRELMRTLKLKTCATDLVARPF